MNSVRTKLIIDEAHAFIEQATRVDLEVGGLYLKEEHYNERTNQTLVKYTKNSTAMTAGELKNSELVSVTKCMSPKIDTYGQLRITKQ